MKLALSLLLLAGCATAVPTTEDLPLAAPRFSITGQHIRACRKFCRPRHQFPISHIDVQATSVRCICAGAGAVRDIEVSK